MSLRRAVSTAALRAYARPERGALPVVLSLLALTLWGCPPTQTPQDDGGTQKPQCETRAECEGGQVCTAEKYCADCESSGQCTLKEECRPDGDAGVNRCALRSGWGSECERNDQCSAGKWCVQGLCKDSADVRLCPSGTKDECLTGQRCNAVNFVCEEDLGCAENTDCSAGEACNKGSHACVPKCTAETQSTVCAGGEKCVNEICVQCAQDSDCGIGLMCDPAGRCVASQQCYQDRDCKVPLVCYVQTGQCVEKPPPCISDENCAPDQKCNVGTGKCVPRACQQDTYEPNNDRAAAKVLVQGQYLNLTLCEADVDYYAFNLSRGDQLGINVDADPFAENTFTTLVQDVTGRTLASGKLLVAYTAPTPETYYVGISTTDLQQPYAVNFLISRGTPCDDDTWEPNDLSGQATPLNAGSLVDGQICPQDKDHFSANVPSGKGVTATLSDYDSSAGLLKLCLLDGTTEASCSDEAMSPTVTATAAQVGGKPVVLRVTAVDERNQNSYTLTVQFQ